MSKEVRALGFPLEHRHKLSCLRQELIDTFVESRYMMFIKYAAFHLQQLGAKKQKEREARSSQEREISRITEGKVKTNELDLYLQLNNEVLYKHGAECLCEGLRILLNKTTRTEGI